MDSREKLLLIFQHALRAVAPDTALLNALHIDGRKLEIENKIFTIPPQGVKVIAAGKGCAPMAAALENLLGDSITQGIAVVKYGHGLPLDHFKIMEAAHPVPDDAGLLAARACLRLAESCSKNDLLICLFTGGASALLPAPGHGLTLEDLREATGLLLASGAEIDEINTIRKHLSCLGGGQLAGAANGATILSLIVSDVICDNLQTIASGPTVPDEGTFRQCMAIIAKYDLAAKMPAAVMRVLQAGMTGQIAETPKAHLDIFRHVDNVIIASNSQAMRAAARKAEELGYTAVIQEEPMRGEARVEAKKIMDKARDIQKNLSTGDKPVCYVAGGETTVTIKGHGKGGRNQEMALAAAMELENASDIAALFAGTDGTDGPVDAAGGFAFPGSVEKMGGHPAAEKFLANNDSYNALSQSGDLLVTGPTRTNVMDLALVLIEQAVG